MTTDVEVTAVAPEPEAPAPEVVEAVESESPAGDVELEGGDQVQAEAAPDAEPREPDIAPEPTAVDAPDLSGLTIAQVRDLNPELARELEYAGEQRKEAQLRRESGTKEETRVRLAAIKAKLAEIPEGDDAGLDAIWNSAHLNASHQHLTEFAEGWATKFEPTAEEREALTTSALSGDINTYAATLLSTAARRIGSDAVYGGGVADIPADSALAKAIQADKQAFAESEVKAALLEAKEPRGSAPPTPSGRPVGVSSGDTDPLLLKLETQGKSALTADEQTRARQLLGLSS